jgi:hypothetical protein
VTNIHGRRMRLAPQRREERRGVGQAIGISSLRLPVSAVQFLG